MGTIKIDLEACAVAEFAQSLERMNTHRRKCERNLQRVSIYAPHMHADQRSTRIKYTAVLGCESYACIQADAPLNSLGMVAVFDPMRANTLETAY